jgi:hypothetical protein
MPIFFSLTFCTTVVVHNNPQNFTMLHSAFKFGNKLKIFLSDKGKEGQASIGYWHCYPGRWKTSKDMCLSYSFGWKGLLFYLLPESALKGAFAGIFPKNIYSYSSQETCRSFLFLQNTKPTPCFQNFFSYVWEQVGDGACFPSFSSLVADFVCRTHRTMCHSSACFLFLTHKLCLTQTELTVVIGKGDCLAP